METLSFRRQREAYAEMQEKARREKRAQRLFILALVLGTAGALTASAASGLFKNSPEKAQVDHSRVDRG